MLTSRDEGEQGDRLVNDAFRDALRRFDVGPGRVVQRLQGKHARRPF